MVVTCEQVWQEVSNYLDGDVSAELRAALEVHVKDCNRCRAVLEGTQNVVSVYADDRVLQVPFGYHQRLRNRLQSAMPRPKGTLYSWALVFAAAALIVGSVALVGAASSRNPLRDQLAQQGSKVPPHLQVIVVDGGKTFHVAGCTFIHETSGDKERIITAAEAMHEGYTPCVRCMREYLNRAALESRPVGSVIARMGQ